MIEINNLTDRDIDFKNIESVLNNVLKLEQKDLTLDISIAIICPEEMQKINKEYRNKDYATDVLSFEGEGDYLGEILICMEEVSSEDEFKRVLIHGLLHLLGYDHEKDNGEMLKKQDKYFTLIN